MPRYPAYFSFLAAAIFSSACHDNEPLSDELGKEEVTRSVEADNTAHNVRDRDDGTKTPLDQSEKPEDLQITATIRSDILEKEGLSLNADNVKIITEQGMVTLRGVVESQQEKDAIHEIAKATPGVVSIDNQLEVTAHP